MKEQNLDFEIAQNFFIEMKYTIQNYLKKNVGMLDFVILDLDLAVIDLVYDHEITQHIHCVMLLCFLRKAFVISLFCCY